MAKRKTPDPPDTQEAARLRLRRMLQFAGWTLAVVALVFGSAWLVWRAERLLVEDRRFFFVEAEPGRPDPALTITGAQHATLASLVAVFEQDRGRSLYRMDPEQRRRALQRVEWVEDAVVRRVWPNRIAVEIRERRPVAFLQTPVRNAAEGAVEYRALLIDQNGVLLSPRGELPSGLPLVSGIRETDHPEVRRNRIRRVCRLLEELGEARENMDEIDVSDDENLKVNYRLHDREYLLVLGNERFAERFERFTRGFPEWKNNLAPRAMVDLTHDSRVVAIPLGAGK